MAFTSYTNDANSLATALIGSPSSSGIELLGSVVLRASSTDAVSYYDGSIASLGIGSGLLLTSGYAPGLVNDIGWDGQDNSSTTGFSNGDADIDQVVNTVFQTQSYDATTLEFDFKATDPNATSISFDIVFGSEEYPEWVDAFVDCAVVIVNGVNYALFNHDPNAPLSVISPNLAAGYFQDNAGNALSIQYDGVSQVLKIVAPINSGGATNHIKIGIADTGDHILDSGIFIANLQAGNIPGSGVVVTPGGCTSGDDTITGTIKNEYIDLQDGNDTAYAGGGDDIVVAGGGNDSVYAGSGADEMEGDAGDDYLDGGADTDTAVYVGNKADYAFTLTASQIQVNSLAEGTDTLVNVEQLKFKDGLFAVVNGALQAVGSGPEVATNSQGAVVISGVALAGKTLTAVIVDADGVKNASGSTSYQWLSSVDGTSWVDTGVTEKTLTLSETDTGLQFKVAATYVDDLGQAESPLSAAVLVAQATGTMVMNPMVITAPEGATVKNPLTTLINNAVALGYTPNEASQMVKNVFGLDASFSIATYDPLAELQANPFDTAALAYIKLAAQVAMTASVSDPSGMNLTLAMLNAADLGAVLDLTSASDLIGVGVDDLSLDVVQGLNIDMADANDFDRVVKTWDDWAGQIDELKPFLGHIDALSVHINQAPVGSATAVLQTNEGEALSFSAAALLDGFVDPDGGTLTALSLQADQGGVFTDSGDGTWVFTPEAGFHGPVEVSYVVQDGQGAAVTATVMLVVQASPVAPNQAPLLVGDVAILTDGAEDTQYTVSALDLLTGYSDADGDALSVADLAVSNGALTDNGDGTYTIVPTADFNGQVDLTYTVTDGKGGVLAATQSYQLAAVNDAPTGGVAISGTAKQGQVLSATQSLADVDGLGVLSYQWLANGSTIANATDTTYTLTAAEVGKTISLRVAYTDGGSTTEAVTSASTAAVAGVTPLALVGTSKNDTLTGAEGNDTLKGLGGNDTLSGLAGNDTLIGGAGTDKLLGGEGSDLYVFDLTSDHSAAEITDSGTTGFDEVRFQATKASTFKLFAGDTGVEQISAGNGTVALNLDASLAKNGLKLVGNGGVNTLTGTAFADSLDGGAGADKLVGGSGNDTYTVDITAVGALQDTVTETGTDLQDSLVLRGTSTNTAAATLVLAATLENLDASATASSLLNLTGNAAANALTGNAAANLINGLDGNDVLFGGLGADTLDGGLGNDLVVYSNANQSNRASTDILKNFDFGGLDAASAVDRLHFEGTTITGASYVDLQGPQFNTQLALETAINGTVMQAGGAVLVHVLNGVAAGTNVLLVDYNGIAGYQAATDYAINLVGVSNIAGFDLSDLLA